MLDWRLNHDEELSDKMSGLQDNIIASSNLISNSMEELNRAINAAGTTMNNAINTFNQLNNNKFIENVVEDVQEADQRTEIENLQDQTDLNNMSFASEMLMEKDKINFALELAIAEVTRKKQSKKDREEEEGEETKIQRKQVKKGVLGVAGNIKLPFVIGTPEFNAHPFAGLNFCNHPLDQIEHYEEEKAALAEDAKHKEEILA